MTRWRWAAIVLSGLALGMLQPGCSGDSKDTEGALGQSQFGEACPDVDPHCLHSSLRAPLALGSQFDVSVRNPGVGGGSPPSHLIVAAPNVLELKDQRLFAKSEGISALLNLSEGGQVLDFLHLWVVKPDALAFLRSSANGEALGEVTERMQILVGESVYLSTEFLRAGQPLSGHGAAEWSVETVTNNQANGESQPAVGQLLAEGVGFRRRLVGKGPGLVKIRVKSLELESSVEVEVLQ